MSNKWSGNDWQAGRRDRDRDRDRESELASRPTPRPGPGPRYGDEFGQAATDSQLLRQFAYAYEDQMRQVRHTLPLASFREPELRSPGSSWRLLLGVGLFVLLLVVAMALGVVLIHF